MDDTQKQTALEDRLIALDATIRALVSRLEGRERFEAALVEAWKTYSLTTGLQDGRIDRITAYLHEICRSPMR